jgi:hypothetical protein
VISLYPRPASFAASTTARAHRPNCFRCLPTELIADAVVIFGGGEIKGARRREQIETLVAVVFSVARRCDSTAVPKLLLSSTGIAYACYG